MLRRPKRISLNNSQLKSPFKSPRGAQQTKSTIENEDVPDILHNLFKEHRGITDLYDWQRECLMHPAVKEGRNLVLSLPTSSGKTLVAEILMLQQALFHKKDTLLILPFVAIVQEKIKSLVPFGLELDILIEEYAANKGRIPPTKRRKKNSIYVATIEKSQSLLNALIELKRTDRLGMVIVDELHMLGEGGSRGACLEQTLAKLIYTTPGCQIVGMSATLSNIDDLLTFLKADLYCCDFRPVKLSEFAKIGPYLYRIGSATEAPDQLLQYERKFQTNGTTNGKNTEDPDGLVDLVKEVVPDNSCLVFCATKKNTENLVLMLARLLPKDLKLGRIDKKKALLSSLREECDGKLCQILSRSIPYGLAYHHSGLTSEERKLIQDAYLDGALCLLCCTSTLAAGVNLPAKRVILRSPMIGNRLLTLQQYKQMSGRAGRAGYDTIGESITILQTNNQCQFLSMLCSGFERCDSSLLNEGAKALHSLILSLLALQIVHSEKEIVDFLNSTLLSVQSGGVPPEVLSTALSELTSKGLITQSASQSKVSVSDIGLATYKGSIDVQIAQKLYQDLLRPLNSGIVLSTFLHLLYCIVPYDMSADVQVNWDLMYREYCSLKPDEKRVFELEKITEADLVTKIRGSCSKDDPKMSVLVRLYMALLLNRLWNQQKVWDVAAYYDLPRGWVQSFLKSSASFAGCVVRFSEHIPCLWPYRSLLPDFVRRLTHCVQMELIPLMDIQGVKMGRARQLYNSGYRTLASIAAAETETLVQQIEHLSKKQAKQIVNNAKMLLQEEIASRMDEMADLLQTDEQSDTEIVQSLIDAVS